jgi:hypothetical protein
MPGGVTIASKPRRSSRSSRRRGVYRLIATPSVYGPIPEEILGENFEPVQAGRVRGTADAGGLLAGAIRLLISGVLRAVVESRLTLLFTLCTILRCYLVATRNTALFGASHWRLAPFYSHARKDTAPVRMRQCARCPRERRLAGWERRRGAKRKGCRCCVAPPSLIVEEKAAEGKLAATSRVLTGTR